MFSYRSKKKKKAVIKAKRGVYPAMRLRQRGGWEGASGVTLEMPTSQR